MNDEDDDGDDDDVDDERKDYLLRGSWCLPGSGKYSLLPSVPVQGRRLGTLVGG